MRLGWIIVAVSVVATACGSTTIPTDKGDPGLQVKADELCRPCAKSACSGGLTCVALDAMADAPATCAATCTKNEQCGTLFPGRTGKCVQAQLGADARIHPVAQSTPAAGALPDDFAPCQGGTCVCLTDIGWCPHRCLAGRWESCNSSGIEDGDGCEQDLTAPQFCGHCGDATDCTTAFPHATGKCKDGAQCKFTAEDCDIGWGDCNGLGHDGCETDLHTATNCGACGHACGIIDHTQTACSNQGACVYQTVTTDQQVTLKCDTDHADCKPRTSCAGIAEPVAAQGCLEAIQPALDGSTAGCETGLGTLANCNGCGEVCLSTPAQPQACVDRKCVASACSVGQLSCNGKCLPLGLDTRCAGCADDCTASKPSELPGKCCVQIMTPATPGQPPDANACVTLSQAMSDAGGDPLKLEQAMGGLMCHAFQCKTGWGNCDKSTDGSCETNVSADVGHCGSCDIDCVVAGQAWKHITSASCAQGQCAYGCEEGYTTCGTDSICLVTLGTNNHCKECGDKCKNGMICSKNACQCPPDKVACQKNGATVCQTPGIDFCEVCGDKCLQSNACSQKEGGVWACKACAGATAYCVAGQSCVPVNIPERCGNCDTNCLSGTPKHVKPGAGGGPDVECLLTTGQYHCNYACMDGWLDCDATVAGCESASAAWPNCGACHACDEVLSVAKSAQLCQSGTGAAPCAAYTQAPANPVVTVVNVASTAVTVVWSSQCEFGWFDCNGGVSAMLDGCECRTQMTWSTPPAWLTGCSAACQNGKCSCDYSAIKKLVCDDAANKCL